MTATPVPRTPRPEVQKRILEAAGDVFAESGYAAASLSAIARRAGFTKGAVYSNYSSKQDLFTALLTDQAAASTEAALAALTGGRPATAGPTGRDADHEPLAERAGRVLADEVVRGQRWSVLLAELAVQATRDPEARVAYVEVRRHREQALADALRRQASALGVEGADFERAALALQVTMSGLMLEHAADPGSLSRDRMAAMLTVLVDGLIGERA